MAVMLYPFGAGHFPSAAKHHDAHINGDPKTPPRPVSFDCTSHQVKQPDCTSKTSIIVKD
jgi:hypothetical protein